MLQVRTPWDVTDVTQTAQVHVRVAALHVAKMFARVVDPLAKTVVLWDAQVAAQVAVTSNLTLDIDGTRYRCILVVPSMSLLSDSYGRETFYIYRNENLPIKVQILLSRWKKSKRENVI